MLLTMIVTSPLHLVSCGGGGYDALVDDCVSLLGSFTKLFTLYPGADADDKKRIEEQVSKLLPEAQKLADELEIVWEPGFAARYRPEMVPAMNQYLGARNVSDATWDRLYAPNKPILRDMAYRCGQLHSMSGPK